MAINDTIQLSVIGQAGGQAHVHTLHFRFPEVGNTEQGIIDSWQANCRSLYRALFKSADSPCIRYSARHVCGAVPLRAAVEETEVAPNIVGASASVVDSLPPFVAAVVSVRTALAGRSRRGRFFLGGLLEEHQANGVLAVGVVGAIQSYVDSLIATFGPLSAIGNAKLVVHSSKLASVPGTQCQNSSTPVTGMLVRNQLGTMRSRKAGSGL